MTPAELITYRKSMRGPKAQGKDHRGLSQAQLAERLGVTVRAVQSWEQGWRPVPAWVPKAIANL